MPAKKVIFRRAGVKPAPTKMAPHERLDLSGDVGTHLSIIGFSRHMNFRRASEGENGIGLVSPLTRRRPPNARRARQREDLISANVKRRTVRYRVRQLRKELDESAFVAYIRQKSGFLPWILTFCFLGAHIQVADLVRGEPEYRPTPQDRIVEIMAREAVHRSLQVIGHGASVSSTDVRPLELATVAQYSSGDNSIQFAAGRFFEADYMLHTAAHESVHVIFNEADLNPFSPSPAWESRLLVEEMTAEVLGAHIAGQVRTRSGGDGATLTRTVIAEYRRDCSWSPQGIRSLLWRFADQYGADRINPEVALSIAVHHGPVEMVDAIDQICRENRDPWVAAHVVAARHIEPI